MHTKIAGLSQHNRVIYGSCEPAVPYYFFNCKAGAELIGGLYGVTRRTIFSATNLQSVASLGRKHGGCSLKLKCELHHLWRSWQLLAGYMFPKLKL